MYIYVVYTVFFEFTYTFLYYIHSDSICITNLYLEVIRFYQSEDPLALCNMIRLCSNAKLSLFLTYFIVALY